MQLQGDISRGGGMRKGGRIAEGSIDLYLLSKRSESQRLL